MAQNDIVKYQFSKGVSGNPTGRPPKEFSITEGIREYLAEDDTEKKKARKDIIVEKVVSMAMRGDKEMIKYVIDRLEGAPKGLGGSGAVIPIMGGLSQNNVFLGTQKQYTDEELASDVIEYSQQYFEQIKDQLIEVFQSNGYRTTRDKQSLN